MIGSLFWVIPVFTVGTLYAQNAELSGLILDPSSASVPGAEVSLRNEHTGARRSTRSNDAGYYGFASLKPGEYRLSIRATGFETAIRDGIRLEVGSTARIDVSMRIGDERTEVVVHTGEPLLNTESASVGTVISRELIDQMPLNGRGIQSLIELSPGTVVLPVANASGGQFAINGQRNNANYFTVDGASANFAIAKPLSNSGVIAGVQIGSGMIPANNFFGTFSNLVAPESLQEFKIQTSTFAPEFGRSPGGQIGLVTRSGTNRLSGSLFEYFRHDKTDANDWFANRQGLPKARLRFHNFGGTLGGPLRIPHLYNGKDRTFFFVSVDELYTRQPQATVSFPVPTAEARKAAPPPMASLLAVYPLPNRPPASTSAKGFADFAGAYSLRHRQHSFSLRGDHAFNERWVSFVRYNRTPSARLASFVTAPTVIAEFTLATETLTFGLTHTVASNLVNDLRLNASRHTGTTEGMTTSGTETRPPDALLFPPGYTLQDSLATYQFLPAPVVQIGRGPTYRARQLQAVDHLILAMGGHQLKFGVDYRWYSPSETVSRSESLQTFLDLNASLGASNAVATSAAFTVYRIPATALVFKAFSAYVQDAWKAARKITLTYGARWEVAPAFRVSAGQAAIAAAFPGEPFAYLPSGAAAYPTTWSNFAPRIGLAWQVLDRGDRKTIVRLGMGKFFDLGQSGLQGAPFHDPRSKSYLNQPLGSSDGGFLVFESPAATLSQLQTRVVAPDYQLPFTWEGNATVEQSIGAQIFTAAYVGALGRRLTAWAAYPQSASRSAIYLNNASSSSYHALQVQFNRRMNGRLHVLASYTWSHSIDDLSSDQIYSFPGGGPTSLFYNPRRKGASDFDIRHALNGSVIAMLPSPRISVLEPLLRNWSANSIFFARTALPTDVLADNYVHRPDVVPGRPLYLYGSQFPGGKSFNLDALTLPPDGRDGNFGRNVLRGLGAWQIDFALHREFQAGDHTRLQFRAEVFNLFNHPNFANPSNFQAPGLLSLNAWAGPGASTQMLANGLSPLGVLGGLSPSFQIGGPRSLQLAVRLDF